MVDDHLMALIATCEIVKRCWSRVVYSAHWTQRSFVFVENVNIFVSLHYIYKCITAHVSFVCIRWQSSCYRERCL